MIDGLPTSVKPQPIFVDTDPGCDDALALAWLLAAPLAEVVGISTVFGSGTLQHTTANALTLLATLQRNVPVTMGASAPLIHLRTNTGVITHGRDAFWGHQQPHNLVNLPVGAPGALAAAARLYPDLTILALGPLTNVARAVQAYPTDLAGVRLVAVAGAHGSGSLTPAAEFNAFADPHALAVVLEGGMHVELVTRDAFEKLRLGAAAVRLLEERCGVPGALLAHLLEGYLQAGSHQALAMPLPAVAAAVYALHPQLGKGHLAVVRVIAEGELIRGQTIMALTERQRATVALGASGFEQLASYVGMPGFDYEGSLREAAARAPLNARVILDLDAFRMSDLLERGFLRLRSDLS